MLLGVTRVPAVMAAVVAAIQERLPNAQVCYGPSTQQLEDDVIVIGLGDEDTLTGVDSTRSRSQGLGRRQTEAFTLHAWLSTLSGDDDEGAIQRAVEHAAQMLTEVAAALEDDDLRSQCDALDLGPDLRWVPVRNTKGTACGVSFDITGTTLL